MLIKRDRIVTHDASLFEMPGHLIRRLHQTATAHFLRDIKAKGYDLTPMQFGVLKTLAEHPDLDQATLAGLVEVDAATIGGVVKRLQQKELVDRLPSPKDKRAFRLVLTPAGKTLLDTVTPLAMASQGDLLDNLTPTETNRFIELMQKALNMNNRPE